MVPAPTLTDHSSSNAASLALAAAVGTASKLATATAATTAAATIMSSTEVMQLESEYGAHNYHPLPVVLDRAAGAHVWDPEGRQYLDFLSAYSAVNQGHCHPAIVAALVRQVGKLTLSSRAFYNSQFAPFAAKMTKLFGYDMVLPMNTGAEAVETALKLARKWGYTKKGIPEGQAKIWSVSGNFHGRTLGIVSMSTDPESRNGFGPFLDGVGPSSEEGVTIRYDHAEDLEAVLEKHGKHTAAFLVEPIQGEAGIIVPSEDYLKRCAAACKKHNVLMICDEIQTGLGRTGKMLACQWDGIRPDIVTLGKALSGGVYPVSAVLADREVMLCIQPGEHGSTYGGNPLGCAVASAALDALIDEDMCARAERLGELFRRALRAAQASGAYPMLALVRGRGLLNAIVIDERRSTRGRTAWQLCLLLKSKGLLAKPTHQNIIRLAPPLVISEQDLLRGVDIIKQALAELDTLEHIPGEEEGH
ncbi:ornithine aminotransferase [Tilletiaria anomala UBC 951]|uniref:Ornithine aminotransferase n=1 Tax=Tilletiaria anomala (strain ATCC 24038 / CBS 436.72 / UBC 951) TaxID=1037660 RepID=A0A066VNB4_TILAU|nr:ornithine aminotransferase [Tilletiaria anomala UBC 951]KDN41768.1 ornithine aminotransferase [Tilletiaria anomala UBC 951]